MLLSKHVRLGVIVMCFFVDLVAADNLGRLFTSSENRKELEALRHIVISEPKKVVPAPKKSSVKKEFIYRDEIKLQGLVHRQGGKNTAWINQNNTYSGDLESLFIEVPEGAINSGNVTITLPDDNTRVNLKVGEMYVPAPLVRDVAP